VTCPIPNTHRRLTDAYALWRLAATAYEDPDSFRLHLNSLIEAVRNVTFMLQSEKRLIPEFETWYPRWQKVLGDDVALMFALNARNRVVHQGDLEKHSTAHVGVQVSWDGPTLTTFEVPPNVPTLAIAALLASQDIPEDAREDGILTVERRWVAAELPDHELLDAYAHCLDILKLLVEDAHRRAGMAMDVVDEELIHPDMGRAMRTVTVNLRTNELIQSHVKEAAIGTYEGVVERYGADLPRAPGKSRDPLDWADWYMEMARIMLQRDGAHGQFAFLFYPDRKQQILSTVPEDQQAKFLFMEGVANTVKRTGATGVVFTADSWYVSPKELPQGKRPADSAARREALTVTALRSDGARRGLLALYERDGDLITFSETAEVGVGDGDDGAPLFLTPVLRAWGLPAPTEEGAH
jgi:hypothetical protein